jgi:hypothetical protein
MEYRFTGEKMDFVDWIVVTLVGTLTATTVTTRCHRTVTTRTRLARMMTDAARDLWLRVVDVQKENMMMVRNVAR